MARATHNSNGPVLFWAAAAASKNKAVLGEHLRCASPGTIVRCLSPWATAGGGDGAGAGAALRCAALHPHCTPPAISHLSGRTGRPTNYALKRGSARLYDFRVICLLFCVRVCALPQSLNRHPICPLANYEYTGKILPFEHARFHLVPFPLPFCSHAPPPSN